MKKRVPMAYLVPVAILVLALGVSVPVISGGGFRDGDDDDRGKSKKDGTAFAKNHNHDDDDEGDDEGNGNGEDEGDENPFEEASLYLELNHTDSDLGLHGLVDGDAWKLLEIESPNEHENLTVEARGSLKKQGLTELFFESDEPQFPDEITLNKFFNRFPAGEWEISGITLEGDELESIVELSHILAEPPQNITINDETAAENCDADPLPAVSEPVTIDWDEVMFSHPTVGDGDDIEVVKYQLIVEIEEPELLIFSVDLPPDVTFFQLPEDFTALADEFKLEIIVKTDTGNQTAVETCFEIE